MDLSLLTKFLSRKLGAVILFTVFCFDTTNMGSEKVLIAKIIAVGIITGAFVVCQAIQNSIEIIEMHVDPDANSSDDQSVQE